MMKMMKMISMRIPVHMKNDGHNHVDDVSS